MPHRAVRPHLGLFVRLVLGAALAVAGVSIGAPVRPVQALPFFVNNSGDASDAVPGDGNCATAGGVCTLRAAVEEANALAGSDTVNLPAGTYSLSLALGSVTITGPLTLQGSAGLTVIDGGGTNRILDVQSSSLTLSGVMLQTAGALGSLRLNTGSTVTIDSVTIANGAGPAIVNTGGTLALTNATISGNAGGGITNVAGNVTLTSVSVISNTNATGGGGLQITAGSAQIINTLLAGNQSGVGAPDCAGAVTSNGHNLFGNTAGCTVTLQASDIANGAAAVAPLAYNGGAANTHALLAGSPAFDAGDSGACPVTDQRGALRQGLACDIGAYEMPIVSLGANAVSVSKTSGAAALTARLEKSTPYTVTVAYATTDLTAQAGQDYTATAGVATLAPFSTSVTITVPLFNDNVFKPSQDFRLDLAAPTGAVLGLTQTVTVTITSPTARPVVSFQAASTAALETAGAAALVVKLDRPAELPLQVNYSTVDGTAKAPGDYTAASNVALTFPSLALTQTINLPISADGLYENTESFTATLSTPAAVPNGVVTATLGSPIAAAVTITNTDPLPAAAFQAGASAFREDAGLAAIPVQLSAPSGVTATVNYAVTGGTATLGQDFSLPAAQVLTFTPGVTVTTVPVTLLTDQIYEGDETLTLTLSGPSVATLGVPVNHTLTLRETMTRLYLPAVMRDYSPFNEQEPDDSFDTAFGPLTSAQNYFGTHAPRRDLDFYYFDTGAEGDVTVEVAGLLANSDTYKLGAQVLLCSGSPCSFSQPNPTGKGFAGAYEPGTTLFRIQAVVPAGRYYVVVVTPDGYTGGQYTLKVTYP